MEWTPTTDSAEDNDAFDRIDVLLDKAATRKTAELARTASRAPAQAPPVDRILDAVEKLLLIRVALEREATPTAAVGGTLDHVLTEVAQLCDEWGFATARVRVDFTREDLRAGIGDLKNDVTELARHLRYDARAWKPVQSRSERRHASQAATFTIAADRGR